MLIRRIKSYPRVSCTNYRKSVLFIYTVFHKKTTRYLIAHNSANVDRFSIFFTLRRPVGLLGCKNGPAPFPGRMSYKATKPGLVFVLYLSMFFIVLLFIRAPFYVLLVFILFCCLSFGCSSYVVITCQVIG